jgi:hypothetical protein
MEIAVIKKRATAKIDRAKADGFVVIDVTSKSMSKFKFLSPMMHVKDIDVPGTGGKTSKTVEGAWQGLKVFEESPADPKYFTRPGPARLKRRGTCRGHEYENGELLGYIEARKKIYVPMYMQHLEACEGILKELKQYPKLVLLDYFDNCDIENASQPLAHASLVKQWLLSK